MTIDKEAFFKILHSHSILAQAEYYRNPLWIDSNPHAQAEYAIINVIKDNVQDDLVNEYFDYVDKVEDK